MVSPEEAVCSTKLRSAIRSSMSLGVVTMSSLQMLQMSGKQGASPANSDSSAQKLVLRGFSLVSVAILLLGLEGLLGADGGLVASSSSS